MKSLLERIKDRCKVEYSTDCWIWTQTKGNTGYPSIRISELSPHPILVRRLTYLLAVGPIGARLLVSAKCGQQLCCNPEHLFLTTREAVGRKALNIANRKLTSDERRRIRNLFLAKQHGKSLTTTWHP